MRWLLLMACIVAKADQLAWVRELETGIVKLPDAYEHKRRGVVIARGAYGITHDAWSEVSTLPWSYAHDRYSATIACKAYLDLTYDRLRAKLGRELTFADVYAGYRYGVAGYARMGGQIWCTPIDFQRKMAKYHVKYQRLTK